MSDNGELCLVASIGEHHYGYIREGIERALSAGKRVIVVLLYAQDVVLAGELWPDARRVYLRPADWALLRRRLQDGRGCTDAEADQLLSSGEGIVKELDNLHWGLQMDVVEGTDSVAEVIKYLADR